MKTFFALLAIWAGNSPVTREFPARGPVTRSFDVFFDLRLNKRLSKQWWEWWFETPSRPLWRHCNEYSHNHRKGNGINEDNTYPHMRWWWEWRWSLAHARQYIPDKHFIYSMFQTIPHNDNERCNVSTIENDGRVVTYYITSIHHRVHGSIGNLRLPSPG